MTTIGVIQLKGGTGRSTVASNLAGGLPGPVALIDCDIPQGTAASWAALRSDDSLHVETASDYRTLIDRVDALLNIGMINAPTCIIALH